MTLAQGIKQFLTMLMTQKRLFFWSLVLMLLTTAAKVIDPIVIAHIIDKSVPAGDTADMLRWGIAYAVIIIISGFLTYLSIISVGKMGIRIVTDLKYKLFSHLLYLPIAWFDKTPVGVLISRVESDCERVKNLFSQFAVSFIDNILFFIGMLIVLLYKDSKVTLILLIPMAVVAINTFIIIRKLGKMYRKSRELNADITARLTEYIQGIGVVQLFNQEDKALDYVNKKSNDKRKNDTKAHFVEYTAWGFNEFLISTVFIIIIILALSPKILGGSLTIGALVIFIQYSGRLVWPMIQISENLNEFQRAFISLRRVHGILNEAKEGALGVADNSFATKHPVCCADTSQGEGNYRGFSHSIVFEDVWFKYTRLTTTDDTSDEAVISTSENIADEWVLKGVSFTIKKGTKVGLVGASGSGKTTCVSLICRFYDIQRGRILVDGRDIYSLPLPQWRSEIGLILQDIILFPGNLLENIRIYNDDISIEKVNKSIENAHAENLLSRMEGNLYNEIKERGQNLSMGERQLISFARALCFDPEIIVMDEATASIDARTENLIHDSIDQVLAGKTAVIVAHKLASIITCDEILLFDNGEIIDRGTHEELLQKSPEYQNLVRLQFVGGTDKRPASVGD